MMRKGETGQALILVLILLVVGALLIIPALRLTDTGLKSSQIVTNQVKALYAAESAQEYVMWKLIYDDFASEFTYDGQEAYLQFNCCGIPVDILVIMRATVAKGAVILATDDVIQPTKSVIPATAPDGSSRTYTYYIRLEQLSDNTSQGLDAVYDILPGELSGLTYITGSSKLRVDGGEWESFGDPSIAGPAAGYGNYRRLRWPASGVFDSPIRDFAVRQVKEIQFQVSGSLSNNKNYVNWVVLDPWDSLSGPQALLTVGSPSNTDIWGTAGMFEVSKVA
ncbi:MAG: hypothetical protein HYU83_05680, partial [Chloroflexi bacterium]|nr:hypothetical protein [Chloroflexota bacterium]